MLKILQLDTADVGTGGCRIHERRRRMIKTSLLHIPYTESVLRKSEGCNHDLFPRADLLPLSRYCRNALGYAQHQHLHPMTG